MKKLVISDDQAMKSLGEQIGSALKGGECLELIGDVGAGKTTLTKGIGAGLIINDDVQSPSFTLSRVYAARDGLSLEHYDFYRLSEPGVMSYELDESLKDPCAITVVEWAQTVSDVLPEARITITIAYQADSEARLVTLESTPQCMYIEENI